MKPGVRGVHTHPSTNPDLDCSIFSLPTQWPEIPGCRLEQPPLYQISHVRQDRAMHHCPRRQRTLSRLKRIYSALCLLCRSFVALYTVFALRASFAQHLCTDLQLSYVVPSSFRCPSSHLRTIRTTPVLHIISTSARPNQRRLNTFLPSI